MPETGYSRQNRVLLVLPCSLEESDGSTEEHQILEERGQFFVTRVFVDSPEIVHHRSYADTERGDTGCRQLGQFPEANAKAATEEETTRGWDAFASA